jgi:hypothetical protein
MFADPTAPDLQLPFCERMLAQPYASTYGCLRAEWSDKEWFKQFGADLQNNARGYSLASGANCRVQVKNGGCRVSPVLESTSCLPLHARSMPDPLPLLSVRLCIFCHLAIRFARLSRPM